MKSSQKTWTEFVKELEYLSSVGKSPNYKAISALLKETENGRNLILSEECKSNRDDLIGCMGKFTSITGWKDGKCLAGLDAALTRFIDLKW